MGCCQAPAAMPTPGAIGTTRAVRSSREACVASWFRCFEHQLSRRLMKDSKEGRSLLNARSISSILRSWSGVGGRDGGT
jgi:hypothetical protein